MKKVLHKIAYTILSIFFFCALLAVDFVSTAKGVLSVSAEEAEVVNFDETDISEDLKDLDMTEYPKDKNGKHEVILFMEYCYSLRPVLAEAYGLYLYVYNPTEKAIKTASANNVANMATVYNAKGEPSAYSNVPLRLLDQTDNNRFLKFKVVSSANFLKRAQSYAAAHEGKRRYDIAGVQLVYFDGTIGALESEDEKVAKTYYYTGFATGCGSDSATESPLKCEVKDLKTLSLDVHPTYYRPEGNNGTDEYTRDSLHSVYFAVPNNVIDEYGGIYAVHGRYLNAVLNPMLVTGNQEAFNAILPYLGEDIGKYNEELEYGYAVNYRLENYGQGAKEYYADKCYNIPSSLWGNPMYSSYLTTLYIMFNSGSGLNSADTNWVSTKEIKEKMLESATAFGGDLVEGAEGSYSRRIFESVDEDYTEFNITSEEDYDLQGAVLGEAWWEKLLGIKNATYFENIEAICPVKASDMQGEPEEIAERLYISDNDFSDFYNYYEQYKNTHTVFLFRYQKSEFVSMEAELFQLGYSALSGYTATSIDTNAYFFKETINLDFDIFDVTFRSNGTDTVFGVVANPIDVVHEGEPPDEITSDKCSCIPLISVQCNYNDQCECFFLGCRKWSIIAAVIGIIILIPVLYLVTYPIRLLFGGANSLAKSERKRRKK